MDLTEVKLESKRIFDGHIVHLDFDTVRLPDGKTATREVIRHNGAVAVVPLTADGKVVMVRQYRYPLARVTLEIPAGKLDVGEDPYSAALRELEEETGMRAASLQCIGKLHPSCAILDECITLYLARDLTYTAPNPDEDEFLLVEAIALDTLCDMVIDGSITDAKTQAAILKTAAILQREGK